MNIDFDGKTYNVIFLGKRRLIKGKTVKIFEVCILKDDETLWRIGLFTGKDEHSALKEAVKEKMNEQ